MILKYNTNNASNIQEFQDKRIETFIERFGTDNPMKVPKIVEKGKQTNIKKYGVSHKMKLEGEYEQRSVKMKKTMYKNGTGISSKSQRYLSSLLNGNLNYPMNSYLLDIAFPEEMIYIEYDGGGHDLCVTHGECTQDEFNKKERSRYYALRKNGWNVIRIKSLKDKLPTDEKILKLLEYGKKYLKSGHSWIKFNIDDNCIENSQGIHPYDFGELRKIK